LTGFLIEIKHLLMPLSGAMEEMAFRNKLWHRPTSTDWFLLQREDLCTNWSFLR
jgi:hypothetical protein